MSQSPITMINRIDAAVEANWNTQVDWLKKLAGFPSIRGNEAECQNWLASEFSARGWAVDQYTLSDVNISELPGFSPVVDLDMDAAVQIVATHEPPEVRGKSLILQGHIDVVPTGPLEQWHHPPFEPRIEGDFMSGRGVNDMKVGVAEMVFALDALHDAGLTPAAKIYIETVTDEECTGNGALSTLARGYVADACLIPEAVGNQLVRAQLGSVWFRLRILGRPVHLMDSAMGASAILSSFDYIKAYQGLAAEYNRAANSDQWYADIENPVGFSAGKIRGGDWVGSVPAWCEVDCRINVLPGYQLSEVRRQIVQTARDCADVIGANNPPEISWIGFQAEAYVLAPGSGAETALAAAHKTITGTQLNTFKLTATSDIRQYGLYYGMPALCYGSAGSGSHSNQERTDLVSMKETTKILALFVANWCGTVDQPHLSGPV